MKKLLIIKMDELKPGDIFSFRTINRPIYWRCVELGDDLIYEGIRHTKYQYHSPIRNQNVLIKK